MSKTPHDLLIGEEYKDKTTGEVKTAWTKVGTVFEDENGGFSGGVTPGIALTGKFIIRERKKRDEG